MAKTLVTVNVICEKDDTQDVLDSLREWFYGHDIGMEFADFHSIEINFLKDYKSFDQT